MPVTSPFLKPTAEADIPVLPPQTLHPQCSWIHWKCTVDYIEKGNVMRHKPLAGNVTVKSPSVDPSNWATLVRATDQMVSIYETTVEDTIQVLTSPSCAARVYGVAVRLGFKIPVPALVKFGDADVVEEERFVREVSFGHLGSVPVFGCVWSVLYLLKKPAKHMSGVANPLGVVDGKK